MQLQNRPLHWISLATAVLTWLTTDIRCRREGIYIASHVYCHALISHLHVRTAQQNCKLETEQSQAATDTAARCNGSVSMTTIVRQHEQHNCMPPGDCIK